MEQATTRGPLSFPEVWWCAWGVWTVGFFIIKMQSHQGLQGADITSAAQEAQAGGPGVGGGLL